MIKTPHYQQQRDHHEQQHQEGPLLQRHVSRREPLLRDDASNLWYTQEETDLFKAWLSHQVHNVRSHLEDSCRSRSTIVPFHRHPPKVTLYRDQINV